MILNAILFCEQIVGDKTTSDFKGITSSITLGSMPCRLRPSAILVAKTGRKQMGRLFLASVWLDIDEPFSPTLVVQSGTAPAQYFETPTINGPKDAFVHGVALDNVLFTAPGMYRFDLATDEKGVNVIASATLDVRLANAPSGLSPVYA